MIKIIMLFALILICSAIGLCFAEKYKKERNFAVELYQFNEQYMIDLKYKRLGLQDILKKYPMVNREYCNRQKNVEYFATLGQSDTQTLIEYLQEMRQQFRVGKDNAILQYKKYSSMYTQIFTLIGILIALLLL